MIPQQFDPSDETTWPPWLRESHICTTPDRPGIFPVTRATWDKWVQRGVAPPPTRFGVRIKAWAKPVIVEARHKLIGQTQSPTPASPV